GLGHRAKRHEIGAPLVDPVGMCASLFLDQALERPEIPARARYGRPRAGRRSFRLRMPFLDALLEPGLSVAPVERRALEVELSLQRDDGALGFPYRGLPRVQCGCSPLEVGREPIRVLPP